MEESEYGYRLGTPFGIMKNLKGLKYIQSLLTLKDSYLFD